MNLYGKKVLLRAIEEEDYELLRSMTNDPATESMVIGWYYPVSKIAYKKWLDSYIGSNETIRLIIERLDTGEAIGMTSIDRIDWKNRSCYSGIKLLKAENKQQGFATDASATAFNYVFNELQLNRINITALRKNFSPKIPIRFGAKLEGIQRQAVYKNGEYQDVILYGILKENFLEAVKNY
ncbi:MAG: GNAT family N-acetyltransferase [Eubacteriaceae bacterium]|jgi:RimJ/RimL family protein N-acetyltransferase